MKEFIKMLKERGIIDVLKVVNKLVPQPKDLSTEVAKAVKIARRQANFDCVKIELFKDIELSDAFGKMCYDLGREALINELEKIMEDN